MHSDIPVLAVRGKTIAEGYEKAIYAVYKNGIEIKTQYDKEGDPLSKDCTLNLTIDEPLADPMIHKAFPGGIADLREYVMELHGDKDGWVKNINDPSDTRWEYTYHGRLANYGAWHELVSDDGKGGKSRRLVCMHEPINQIEHIISKLTKQPYTRQAQMITWIPKLDLDCYDPPCLQSIWMRIIESNESSNIWSLNTNIRFRSNDGWGASFMNMFGLTQLIHTIAVEIGNRSGKTVRVGRLNWQADSYHIYGKDISSCKQRLIDKIETNQLFEKRVWNFNDETVQEMYRECEVSIREKIRQINVE
jgi:thymidylate synthase